MRSKLIFAHFYSYILIHNCRLTCVMASDMAIAFYHAPFLWYLYPHMPHKECNATRLILAK